jgi:hypothetical protein
MNDNITVVATKTFTAGRLTSSLASMQKKCEKPYNDNTGNRGRL